MQPEKEIRADAKLMNLAEQDPQVAEDMWRFRHPEKGGKKLTLEAILVEVPLRYGFTLSLSSLHRFYRWLGLKRRMDERREFADQLKAELARDPDTSEEMIKEAGTRIFLTEGIIQKDAKIFADMVRIGQVDRRLQQNDRKLELQGKVVGIDERKLAIMEAKAARLDALEEKAKQIKADGGLSAETLELLEKQLKLL